MRSVKSMPGKRNIIKAYADHVSPGKVDLYTKYDMLLVPAGRSGPYIYDMDGTRYINCHCNGGVFNLGHRNSRVIRAVTEAMENFDIGNHHLISAPKALLAKAISGFMPKGLNQIVYGVGGGEAIDLAIKLARGVTGRTEIVSALGGYHGHTGLALATGDEKYRVKFGPGSPGFLQVPFNDSTGIEKAISSKTAAVIFETIPATMGIVVPGRDFFRKVRSLCDAHGALFIIDEVQTGFGRTGKLWGFDHFNIVPDIVVLGKGMSGGIYPISATVYQEKYADLFRKDPFVHISTYGGSEIGCFAALEVLRISAKKAFLDRVKNLGSFFRAGISSLAKKYAHLGLKHRGVGLMMGLEFRDEGISLLTMKLMFDNGVYLVYSGNDPRVLQFLPPLTITEAQGRDILRRFDRVLKSIAER